jgi:hypothetical protein
MVSFGCPAHGRLCGLSGKEPFVGELNSRTVGAAPLKPLLISSPVAERSDHQDPAPNAPPFIPRRPIQALATKTRVSDTPPPGERTQSIAEGDRWIARKIRPIPPKRRIFCRPRAPTRQICWVEKFTPAKAGGQENLRNPDSRPAAGGRMTASTVARQNKLVKALVHLGESLHLVLNCINH